MVQVSTAGSTGGSPAVCLGGVTCGTDSVRDDTVDSACYCH